MINNINMTTAKYQLIPLCLTLSCLIALSLSLELIEYETVVDPQNADVEKIKFQLNAITLAGGPLAFTDDHLIYKSVREKTERAEFAENMTGNRGFLSRYIQRDSTEPSKWDARIENALKFTSYNVDNQRNPRSDRISNQLYYYGSMLYKVVEEDKNRDYYITSLFHKGGVQVLKNMLADDAEFIQYLENPYHRILFYIDLIRIWTILTMDMKMRICMGSPATITVRVPDENYPTYRPIFRHPEWAVNLKDPCEDFSANYSSKSVLTGKIESTETYQKTIETFTLGRIIYYIEVLMAHNMYEKKSDVMTILNKQGSEESKIMRFRGWKENNYENVTILNAHVAYRKLIKGYREANPLENLDQDKAVNSMYEGMFDLLDRMVRENDVMNGRPNWSDVGKGFTKLLGMVNSFNVGRRMLVI